jgi:hypothetical protein
LVLLSDNAGWRAGDANLAARGPKGKPVPPIEVLGDVSAIGWVLVAMKSAVRARALPPRSRYPRGIPLRAVSCLVACVLAPISVAAATAQGAPRTGSDDLTPVIRAARPGMPVFVGARFHQGTRVTVTLTNGKRRHTRTVRASRAGTFTVRFTFVAVDPCRGTLDVTAVDPLGARARWTRECRPPSLVDPTPA